LFLTPRPITGSLVLAAGLGMAACAKPVTSLALPAVSPVPKPVIAVQSYARGLAGVHPANPVEVRIDRDPELPGEPVLVVEYPERPGDPAGRDVWCDSENRDWTTGRALSFQIKPANPERISVSFMDRNRVVYTAWIDLQGGVWQPVLIRFQQLRPNPYVQPPDAKTGAPMDLSDIGGFAFAPHNRSSGQLRVSRFVLTE
jgi:hypothetical protein